MRRGLACALALWPLSALAEGGPLPATADELAALTGAMIEAGCRVTEANGDAVLAASGLSDARAGEIVFQMVNEGRATPAENGDLILNDPACPPQD